MGLIETFAEKAIASGAYQPLDKVYVANKVRALVGYQDGDVQAGRSIAEQLVDLSIENGKIEDGQTEREILNEQLFDLLTPTRPPLTPASGRNTNVPRKPPLVGSTNFVPKTTTLR